MNDNREKRKMIAEETLRIIQSGQYNVGGKAVDIADSISFSRENSILISQGDAEKFGKEFQSKAGTPVIELTNESTLSAILRMNGNQVSAIGVLNFASAKNPGGGFLNGALAQEESLAIASSLYDSQTHQSGYYDINRTCKSMMYTDTDRKSVV